MACRLVPSPEMRTATRKANAALRSRRGRNLQHRIWATRGLEGALLDQLVNAGKDVGAAHLRRGAVARQAVIGVALDLGVTGAVEDLGAGGAANRGAGAPRNGQDRVVEVADRLGVGRGGDGGEVRIAHVAASTLPGRLGSIAEVAQYRPPSAALSFHVGPDLPVLAPAGPGALLDRRAAERRSPAVE